MDNENEYFEETPEQSEALDEVLTKLAVVAEDLNPDIDPFNLPLETPLRELFEDFVAFGIGLAQIHLYFGIIPSYTIYSEFDYFDNLNDIFQYLGEKVLTERELW